jgi:hypothetical protein
VYDEIDVFDTNFQLANYIRVFTISGHEIINTIHTLGKIADEKSIVARR